MYRKGGQTGVTGLDGFQNWPCGYASIWPYSFPRYKANDSTE